MQYYQEDSLIGATDVPEDVLMNGFANFNYTNGNFSAGFRYESYLNASFLSKLLKNNKIIMIK